MFDDIELLENEERLARIKIIGVGGAGNNAINRMIEEGIQGVEFIAVNCDAQDLKNCLAPKKLLIGEKVTRGLGAGGKPEVGELAAQESKEAITKLLSDTDMLFITAGMGGGTGTGASPVIAECARELKILTVGVVSKPFKFEGKRCMRMALEGLKKLADNVDTIVPIPNEALMKIVDKRTTMKEAFVIADNVLCQGVEGIYNLISVPGFINLDFADIKSIMRNAGMMLMGIGVAQGNDAASIASNMAINNPLLENTIDGAKGIIVNISGGMELSLDEVNGALSAIQELVDEDANIIIGTALDASLGDVIKVTVIATGFEKKDELVISVVEPPKPVPGIVKPWNNESISQTRAGFVVPPWVTKSKSYKGI